MTEPRTPEGGPPQQRTPLDALLERLQFPAGVTARLGNLVMLAVISIAAAFVLSPGLLGQNVPELTAEDVGKPYRASSASGFKADRDYEIENQSMTGQRQKEARAAIRPVYDLNPAVRTQLDQAVISAFTRMREIAATPVEPPEPEVVETPPPGKRGPKLAAPPPLSAEEQKQLLDQRLLEARSDFEQRLFGAGVEGVLEAEDFQAMADARFAPSVEQGVRLLLERGYAFPIVAGRDELERDGTLLITVRDLKAQTELQRSVVAPSVLDLKEAHGELDRFASVPGNLLPDQPATLRRAALRTAKRLLRPNVTVNIAETEARRKRATDGVKPAVITVKKGQKVIGDGELINETHLVIAHGIRAQTRRLDLFQIQVGGAGMIALLIGAAYVFHRAAFRRFKPTRKDAVLLGSLLLVLLGFLQLWISISDAIHDRYSGIPSEALYYAVPVAAGAMLVRFILAQELALFFAIVFSALAGVMLSNSLSFTVFTLIGSLVAADRITRAKDRVGIFKAGVAAGVVNLFAVMALALAEGKGLTSETLLTSAFAFLGTALFVPVTVMALTPLVEVAFGYASDIKLLELANLNHPALKELIVQAPGTYHHSIIIGSLVENAAESIGANPLLARTCAYYHDIGKGRNPLFFGENQKGENRHDALAPSMSAVIIKRHVTEGMEMARQYRLPKLVADAIPQHHGTRLVGYFFHKAVKEQEGKENPQPIDESIFRYPGPKPQFQEAALVMIADAVEASTRAMPDPTSAKLQAQVQKIINLIFSEGQLDECDLTLRDLTLVARSFLHTLEGIYHTRPEYPPGALMVGRHGEVMGTTTSEPRRTTGSA